MQIKFDKKICDPEHILDIVTSKVYKSVVYVSRLSPLCVNTKQGHCERKWLYYQKSVATDT